VVEPDLRKQPIKSRPFFLPHPLFYLQQQLAVIVKIKSAYQKSEIIARLKAPLNSGG
jgi:hypothetical protein